MGFTWECDGNTLEEKGMIEDSLPEGFTYKIAKYKLIERSEIEEEIKFRPPRFNNILLLLLSLCPISNDSLPNPCQVPQNCRLVHLGQRLITY